jgi:hypothetical protein
MEMNQKTQADATENAVQTDQVVELDQNLLNQVGGGSGNALFM